MTALQARFGKLVATRRREKRLTQAMLAEMSEQSKDMIAKIEAGRTGVSFENVEQLAKSLDVDPAALFSAELPSGSYKGGARRRIMERLSLLAEPDLTWIEGLLEAALKPRRQESPLEKTRIKTRVMKAKSRTPKG